MLIVPPIVSLIFRRRNFLAIRRRSASRHRAAQALAKAQVIKKVLSAVRPSGLSVVGFRQERVGNRLRAIRHRRDHPQSQGRVRNLSHELPRDALWSKRDECEERGAANMSILARLATTQARVLASTRRDGAISAHLVVADHLVGSEPTATSCS